MVSRKVKEKVTLPEIILQGGTAAAVAILLWWNSTLLKQIDRLEKQVERLTTHLIAENVAEKSTENGRLW